MSEITFKDKKKEKVFQYITEAISFYNPNTAILNANNHSRFERIVYVLGDLIIIQGFNENNDRKRFMISIALANYSKQSCKTLESFSQTLTSEVQRQKNQPLKEFLVVFPLNISYSSIKAKRHFVCRNLRLNCRSLEYVKTKFAFEEPYQMLSESKIANNFADFTFITTKVTTSSSNDAFWVAYRALSLFRSLGNFVLSYGTETIMMSPPHCLGLINPPRLMFIFDENRKYIEHWFNSDEFKFDTLTLEAQSLTTIAKTVYRFERIPQTSVKNILTNCFTVHQYALDETEYGYIFLNMWQILELISLKDQSGITEDKVKNRIKIIFGRDTLVSDTLDILFNKRNHLVHEGQLSNFTLADVNQVKNLTEATMRFLFRNSDKLKTISDLQSFYENLDRDNAEIDKKIGILRFIKKLNSS